MTLPLLVDFYLQLPDHRASDDPEEWRRIGQETGFNDVCERAEAKWGVIDAISLKIYATPASTFAGLAVKFRAMASDCYTRGELAQPDAEMDWRPLCFARVMRDVERLAKLEA